MSKTFKLRCPCCRSELATTHSGPYTCRECNQKSKITLVQTPPHAEIDFDGPVIRAYIKPLSTPTEVKRRRDNWWKGRR